MIDEAFMLGLTHLAYPGTPTELRNPEGYRQVKGRLETAAAILNREGITLSYHNHEFEFGVMIEGRPALEYLLDPGRNGKLGSDYAAS